MYSPEDPGSEEEPLPVPAPRVHRGSDVLTARHPWWCSGSLVSAVGAGAAAAAASILRLLAANGSLLLHVTRRRPAASALGLGGRVLLLTVLRKMGGARVMRIMRRKSEREGRGGCWTDTGRRRRRSSARRVVGLGGAVPGRSTSRCGLSPPPVAQGLQFKCPEYYFFKKVFYWDPCLTVRLSP